MPDDHLECLDEGLRTGFLTHAFLEAGRLTDKEPMVRVTRAKDERRLIYDLASLTKALVTAPLAFRLLQTAEHPEKLTLADIKGLASLPPSFSRLSIESLLGHRSGLPAWRNFWMERLFPEASYPEMLQSAQSHLFQVIERVDWQFGEAVDCYSDVGFILLGLALEKHSGLRLHEQFQDFLKTLQRPAYGEKFGFASHEPGSKQHFITSAYCPIRERWLRGEVHDENAAALGGVAGHAGLFASGRKLSSFLRQHFQSSEGQIFWEENERRRREGKPLLGLRLGDDQASSVFADGQTIGHWGFTGTGFWVHVPSSRYGIMLTNRVISSRRSTKIQQLRHKVFTYLDRSTRP